MDNMKILKEACFDLLNVCRDFRGNFNVHVNDTEIIKKDNITSKKVAKEIENARTAAHTIEKQIQFLLDKDYCDSVYAAAKKFIRIYENENHS